MLRSQHPKGTVSKIRYYLQFALGIHPEQRIYIFPTWFCIAFNFAIVGMMSASFPLRSFALFGLAIFLIFILLLSMVETHINLRDLEVNSNNELILESFSKGVLTIDISSREQAFGINLGLLDDKSFVQDVNKRSEKSDLKRIIFKEFKRALFTAPEFDGADSNGLISVSHSIRSVQLPFVALDRGVQNLPRLIVVSFFPFGLFRAVRVIKFSNNYIAYPKPKKTESNRPIDNQSLTQELKLAAHSHFLKGSEDYSHHREFNFGDTMRRVDWKASSRRAIKIVKEFGSPKTGSARIIRWNDTISQDVEGKLSELCYLVLEAAVSGQKFAVELPHHRTNISSGERHKLDCLRQLAIFNNSSVA